VRWPTSPVSKDLLGKLTDVTVSVPSHGLAVEDRLTQVLLERESA